MQFELRLTDVFALLQSKPMSLVTSLNQQTEMASEGGTAHVYRRKRASVGLPSQRQAMSRHKGEAPNTIGKMNDVNARLRPSCSNGLMYPWHSLFPKVSKVQWRWDWIWANGLGRRISSLTPATRTCLYLSSRSVQRGCKPERRNRMYGLEVDI